MQCLLQTFEFMASNNVKMLHGDLKPDNVILHEDREHVQLIDFGLASSTHKMQKNMYIQSRWYRSPEVLLGLPATAQVDMWTRFLRPDDADRRRRRIAKRTDADPLRGTDVGQVGRAVCAGLQALGQSRQGNRSPRTLRPEHGAASEKAPSLPSLSSLRRNAERARAARRSCLEAPGHRSERAAYAI
eukprot:3934226-Rhodomonas_salina.1